MYEFRDFLGVTKKGWVCRGGGIAFFSKKNDMWSRWVLLQTMRYL